MTWYCIVRMLEYTKTMVKSTVPKIEIHSSTGCFLCAETVESAARSLESVDNVKGRDGFPAHQSVNASRDQEREVAYLFACSV